MHELTHLMFWVLVGHLVGDYLLQDKRMALTKGAKTLEGVIVCLMHCILYSAAVTVAACLALSCTDPTRILIINCMVFLTHFPIDRWSLADKYLKLIRGRQLDEVFKEIPTHTGSSIKPSIKWRDTEYLLADKAHVADVATRQAFTALVYAVADNTLHFLLMTAGFAALLHLGVLP